jgi:hypothetical protein
MQDNHLSPTDNIASPLLEALITILGSKEAAQRWCHSMALSLNSKAAQTVFTHHPSREAALLWLKQTTSNTPKPKSNIARFHVSVPDKDKKLRKTTVSLDHAMLAALTQTLGSPENANKWIQKTTRNLNPGSASLSRTLQAQIIHFVSQPRDQSSPQHTASPGPSQHPSEPTDA